MAIQITKQLELNSGLIVYSLYLRIGYAVNEFGNQIMVIGRLYASKESFKNEDEQLRVKDGIHLELALNYVEGDILQFIHDELKKYIIQKEFCIDSECEIVDI